MIKDSADHVNDIEDNVTFEMDETTDVVGVDTPFDVGDFASNFTGVIGSQHVALPSQSLSQVNRHAASKTTMMSGKAKFNAIIEGYFVFWFLYGTCTR